MVRIIRAATTAAGTFLLTTNAWAAATSPASSTPDPEEKICERITVTGSRLVTKTVCATRREWAEKRRQDRAWIEKAQREPCVVQQIDRGSPVC